MNIGPLLAGAGVIGLAIGFGAQTLVRDIITGVFLLLDDAFRVGEFKEIGEKLAADLEHAPHIMEPMKMQGVDAFGDFAIQVRVKMKTRPGEQFVIRRKANALIKKAFDENGIKFASPTVQVSGGDAAGVSNAVAAAAASQANKPPPQEYSGTDHVFRKGKRGLSLNSLRSSLPACGSTSAPRSTRRCRRGPRACLPSSCP